MEVHPHSHTSTKKWDELANLTAMGGVMTMMTEFTAATKPGQAPDHGH